MIRVKKFKGVIHFITINGLLECYLGMEKSQKYITMNNLNSKPLQHHYQCHDD